MAEPNTNYYDKGSSEAAQLTALTLKKLEQRRKLTGDSERLVIVLVGLPGRGKSFIARKLQHFLTWRGSSCRVFNVGKYRRHANAEMSRERHEAQVEDTSTSEKVERADLGSCDAKFFDPNNAEAAALREKVAAMAMEDMLKWLDYEGPEEQENNNNGNSPKASFRRLSSSNSGSDWGVCRKYSRVAIYDATNSTKARRDWVLEECTCPVKRAGKRTGVIFVESLCDDQELLDQNFQFKIQNSPDFKGMSKEEAIADLRSRVEKYESQYETISDDSRSYIKIYNLSSKLMVNHIYGRMAKVIVPALMAWNIGTRPVFICRAGQTTDDGNTVVNANHRKASLRGDVLGHTGRRFTDALAEYILSEGIKFMENRENVVSLDTGTSVSGLRHSNSSCDFTDMPSLEMPFSAHIMTSTMPRAIETATWERLPFPVHQISNLNPLDKGDFTGMELEEIKEADPDWYGKLEQDPFRTRYVQALHIRVIIVSSHNPSFISS
uniref:6-phosphofructo-2-kinase domain-containing protein n=2 Tax=Ditylum brightwellii TaxID=49249 RepID=A0A7S4V5D3_9STRA